LKAAFPSTSANEIHWQVRDAPRPQPGPKQILLRVKAASINRGETVLLKTSFKEGVGGIDAAGEVVETGAEVTRLKPGDRVTGRCAGGFAEFAAMNEAEAMAVPASARWEDAACLPVSFTVAWDALVVNGNLAKGEIVLVTGVSSAVGVAALALAKHAGATVIGTSGSAEKLARLAALDVPIKTRSANFSKDVLLKTGGKGANIAIDAVGAAYFQEILRSLAVNGRFATIGQMTGSPKVELDMDFFAMRRLRLYGVSNRLRTPEERAQATRRFAEEVMPAVASGALKPLVDKVFALDEVEEAHRYVYADRQVGKVLIKP
jgi:NADPH:quinone reductase-like Zn-dependent oxidoreductase